MNFFFELLDGKKSFKPVKNYTRDNTNKYSLHKESFCSLGAKIEDAVKLPAGEDLNEWLAVHVVDFYNIINMIFGQIEATCSTKTCPKMTAGPKFNYLWRDETLKNDTPKEISAKEYASNTLDWIKKLLDDEKTFPSSKKVPFPKNFQKVVKGVFKKVFRLYAHVMLDHFKQIQALGLEAHINSSLKHFLLFCFEFQLIEKKELEPLKDWIDCRQELAKHEYLTKK